MRRGVAILASAFLLAFALDAALSVADELVRLGLASAVLTPGRNLVARIPLGLAPPIAGLLLVAPALRLAAFLPALAFLAWTLAGALPLPLWPPERHPGLVIASIQAGLALLAFLVVRLRSPSRSWWIRSADLAAAPFRPLRALGLLLAGALLAPAAFAAYTALAVAAWIERASDGFMRFELDGIVASERDYARGEQSVRLVGMMHVGEDAAYRELVSSFEGADLVLAEGVTDRDGLLREGLGYQMLAQPLGLVVQPEIEEELGEIEADEDADAESAPQVVRADVDIRDFSEETLAFLRAYSQIFASPDLATGLERARDFSRRFDAKATARILRDLIERRNAHLLHALDEALPEHRSIVVPWGALHLPEIEDALEERGFQRTGERSRPLVRYATLARALASSLASRGDRPADGE